MALEFVFPALVYVEKANFHVNYEQIDSKWHVNNFMLSVSEEADRFKSRPLFPRKSLFDGRAKRCMGKWRFYAFIDRRKDPNLSKVNAPIRNISTGLVIKLHTSLHFIRVG